MVGFLSALGDAGRVYRGYEDAVLKQQQAEYQKQQMALAQRKAAEEQRQMQQQIAAQKALGAYLGGAPGTMPGQAPGGVPGQASMPSNPPQAVSGPGALSGGAPIPQNMSPAPWARPQGGQGQMTPPQMPPGGQQVGGMSPGAMGGPQTPQQPPMGLGSPSGGMGAMQMQSPQAIYQAIMRNNPGIDPQTAVAATQQAMQLQKINQPEEIAQMRMMQQQEQAAMRQQMAEQQMAQREQAMQNRNDFERQRLAMEQERIGMAQQNAGSKGWQVVNATGPDGKPATYRMNVATGEVQPLSIGNVTKIGGSKGGEAAPNADVVGGRAAAYMAGQAPGMGKDARANAIAAVHQQFPELSEVEIARRANIAQGLNKTLTLQQEQRGKTEAFEQTTLGNLDEIQAQFDEMQKSKIVDLPYANSLLAKWKQVSGQAYNQGTELFGREASSELAKLASSATATGAGGTLADREEWNKFFASNGSYEQMKKSLNAARRAVAIRTKSQDDVIAKTQKRMDDLWPSKGGKGGQSGGGPSKGDIEGGYRFKGGDPSDQANWEQVQ